MANLCWRFSEQYFCVSTHLRNHFLDCQGYFHLRSHLYSNSAKHLKARIECIMNVQSHICTNDNALVSYFQSRPRAAGEEQVVRIRNVYKYCLRKHMYMVNCLRCHWRYYDIQLYDGIMAGSDDRQWWIIYAAIGGALLLILLLIIALVGIIICCRRRSFVTFTPIIIIVMRSPFMFLGT